MPDPTAPTELVTHLTQVSQLDAVQAARVVGEICAYFDERVEDFICRRHAELRADGLTNIDIYRRIVEELEHRRFPSPAFSQRQIRRLIYG